MIHRLALVWGKSVRQIEDEYTAEDIKAMMDLYELEPWGCEAEDHRFTQLAYLIAQVNSKKSLNYADFLPPWRKPKKKIVPYEVGIIAHIEHLKRRQKST